MSNYIKDNNNRMIGSIKTEGNKTTVRNFSGQIVSTYNSNTNRTTDWKTGKTCHGNQAIRFLK
jgi:hypothetical protein